MFSDFFHYLWHPNQNDTDMVLNYIWIAFFALAFIVAAVRLLFFGDTEIFPAVINSTFDSSKTAFEISICLTGVLSLWLGIMKIGEKGGVVNMLSRALSPLFCKLFPDIPKGHPVTGSIFMNLAANMLGLDNAATPLGLKAMEGLQELNPKKDTASNPMIMFLVLNTSGLTLIPISIMVYRAQLGAAQPTDVFVPILLATFFSTLAGIIAVGIYQKINLFNRTVLLFLGGASLSSGRESGRKSTCMTHLWKGRRKGSPPLSASSLIWWRYWSPSACSALRGAWTI